MTHTAAERSGHAPNEANIQFKAALENIEVVFAFFFFMEMMVKMAAVGLMEYLSNGFNVLDAVIVFCSIFELIATLAGLESAFFLNALRALR